MSDWISVKNKLPDVPDFFSYDIIICFNEGSVVPAEVHRHDKVWDKSTKWQMSKPVVMLKSNGAIIKNFTHWMPLPEPPKG